MAVRRRRRAFGLISGYAVELLSAAGTIPAFRQLPSGQPGPRYHHQPRPPLVLADLFGIVVTGSSISSTASGWWPSRSRRSATGGRRRHLTALPSEPNAVISSTSPAKAASCNTVRPPITSRSKLVGDRRHRPRGSGAVDQWLRSRMWRSVNPSDGASTPTLSGQRPPPVAGGLVLASTPAAVWRRSSRDCGMQGVLGRRFIGQRMGAHPPRSAINDSTRFAKPIVDRQPNCRPASAQGVDEAIEKLQPMPSADQAPGRLERRSGSWSLSGRHPVVQPAPSFRARSGCR